MSTTSVAVNNNAQLSNRQKCAFITGISGQDGHFLTELLLEKGYRVVGTVRRTSTSTGDEINSKDDRIKLFFSDLTDIHSLIAILKAEKPDEIYNLGAQSHVQISFEIPEYTANVIALGTLRLLEAVRSCGLEKHVKFFQAFTSDIFENPKPVERSEGDGTSSPASVALVPQNEQTKMHPRSPYGCAKLFSYWIVKNYREAYGMFAVNAILFNHESSRRGESFVTRKITSTVARIKFGLQSHLELGNLDAMRDWGHAKDYVRGMYLMMQHSAPDDFCLSTGEVNTVRDFCTFAFRRAGIDIEWRGERGTIDEIAVNKSTGEMVVKVNPQFFRPIELAVMHGDSSKAEKELGWKRKFTFKDLVEEMMSHDLEEARKKVALGKWLKSRT